MKVVAHKSIETAADITKAVRALRRRCEFMRAIHDRVGDPAMRRHPTGIEGVARIIIGQQLSTASARAIWERFAMTVTPLRADTILAMDNETLRGAGLSRPKIRTLRALATSIAAGLDLDRLATAPDEEVHEALRSVSGIGPWSADIYLMFCLGRADAWAAGDLALQIAAQSALGLDEKPTSDELLEISERWRPWRSVAALLLWKHYAHTAAMKKAATVKSKEPLT